MIKEVLLYGSIDSYSSAEFITALEAASNDEISVRVNTEGGSPEYGWGMVAKFAEHTGAKRVKGDGQAHSMGAFFFCYADKGSRECLDVCEFLIHRAAYADWYENSDMFDDTLKGNLERVNASLQKAFTNTVDVKLFEEIANEQIEGIKVADIFKLDSRLEICLTAKQAKKIGLVDKVISITPEKRTEIAALLKTASKNNGAQRIAAKTEKENPIQKTVNMTKEEFKAQHPAIYNEVFKAGKAKGVKVERDRVGAFLAYVDVDAEGVKTAIKNGTEVTQTALAEFSVKMASPEFLEKIKKDSKKDPLDTDAPADTVKTEKEKNAAAFDDEIDKKLCIGKYAKK